MLSMTSSGGAGGGSKMVTLRVSVGELPFTVTEALTAEVGKAAAERQGSLLLALADRNDDAVSPAILVSEIEIQRRQSSRESRPFLPRPEPPSGGSR